MRRAALLVWMMGGAGCLRTPCEQDGLCFAVATQVALRPIDHALASADIDGDGHLDLVSVGGTAAALRRGHGDGSLAAPMVWTLPAEAEGLALGDLDGDGAQELVTTFPSRGSLAWLQGTVGGWDARPRELEVGADIRVLLTADLNGDGADELIASERDRGRLHLWMGASAGPGASRYVDIGGEASALVALDHRGDAGLELAVAIPSLGVVERREFSPAVGLERTGTVWASAFPVSLVMADLDADGRDDLAAIDSLDRTLWIGLGDGDGGWHREHSWPLAETPRQIFARRGPTAPELGIISGDGNGVTLIEPFSGAARIEAIAADALQAVVTGDFVAGGSEELVYLHGSVTMVEELAGYRAQPRWTAPASGLTGLVVVVDLDGDGVPELVAEHTTQAMLVVFAGAGSDYVEVARHALAAPLAGLRALARAGGGADLVWWQTGWSDTSSPFGVLTYMPGSGLSEAAMPVMDEQILDIVAADHDGDGRPDLAVTVALDGDNAGLQALVFMMREPEGGWTIGPRVLEGEVIDAVVAAQIDGVGGEDLWVVGAWDVRAVLGGAATPLMRYYGGPSPTEATFQAADLDGDGQEDLVVCDHSIGAFVAAGHPDGSLDPPAAIFSAPCDQLIRCDLDADGDLDLVALRRPAGASRGAIQVYHADPDGWQATGAFADAPNLLHTAMACHGPAILHWSGTASGGTLRGVVDGPALRETSIEFQYPWAVQAADLNGDGLDDLFTHDLYRVAVAFADGEGGYSRMQSLAAPLAAGQYVVSVTTAELGGRPGKELLARIISLESEASLKVWSLQAPEIVAVGSLPEGSVIIGDLDGDGRDELLIGIGVAPQLLWFGADGTRTRTLTPDPALLEGVMIVRFADVDGDGQDDLLVRRSVEADEIEMLRSRGDGSFEAPRMWAKASIHGGSFGDVDADGAPDLVAFEGDEIVVARGDGDGGMGAVSRHPHALDVDLRGPPLVDDLDGDGRAELLLLVGDREPLAQPPALQVVRPGRAGEPPPPWSLGLTASGSNLARVQVTADTPGWAVLGGQGAIIVTAEGNP